MPDDTKKLREEIERRILAYRAWGDESSVLELCKLVSDNRDTIDTAMRAVEALPKTADGVPIVPGMELWFVFKDGIVKGTYGYRSLTDDRMPPDRIPAYFDPPIDVGFKTGCLSHVADPMRNCCYSSRAAALASHPPTPTANVNNENK